jgi:moderate conductance mechanosensitive channel
VLLQVQPTQQLVDACGAKPSWACRRIFEATGNKALAGAVDVVLAAPVRILFIIFVAFVASRLCRRAIRRFTDGITGSASAGRLGLLREHVPMGVGAVSARAVARAETIGSVLRSIASAVIWAIAAATILGELGINLGPLIASAGIAGVAFGFGAQSLVKDFLSGMFMLLEDQYGVGDVVDVGDAVGTVESVGLRTTRIRDDDGTVWHVPNGQIARVANMSQEA